MSRIVKIPECMNPFDVWVNGAKYSYPAGTEQEVPDNVADVIEHHIEQKKAEPAGVNACNADLVISFATEATVLGDESTKREDLSIKSGSLRSVFERLKKKEEVKVILEHEYLYGAGKFVGFAPASQVTSYETIYGDNVIRYIMVEFILNVCPGDGYSSMRLICTIDVGGGKIERFCFK